MTLSSTLTYESRIPSETSLTFYSQHTSPVLVCDGGKGQVEPMWLEEGMEVRIGTVTDLGELGLPFQELADFDFDGHDLGDEEFLEMAPARK